MAGPPAPRTNIPPDLADPALVGYLLAHKDKAQFLLATMNIELASLFILDTGQAVMALGGYDGSSRFLTRDELIQQIDSGTVRFFLLPSPSFFYGDLIVISWVSTHCGAVPTNQWQSPSTASFAGDRLQLYDCAHHT